MSEVGGEAAGGGRGGAGTELKTKTPHVNVGKKHIPLTLKKTTHAFSTRNQKHLPSRSLLWTPPRGPFGLGDDDFAGSHFAKFLKMQCF